MTDGEACVTKTIYVDILFLINFIINYLILFTSAKVGAARIRRLRLFSGALVGAVYGVLVFFPDIPFITSFVSKIAVSVLMVICSFGVAYILRMTLLFLAVSLAFGGVVLAASLLGAGDFFEVRGGVYYIHISVSALLSCSAFAYLLLSLVFKRSAARSDRKISRVAIYDGDAKTELAALNDTGNTLCDPATNAPVVISDYRMLREILPHGAREILDSASPDAFPLSLDKLSGFGSFKLIPYKTVGVPFKLMLAYRPEQVFFDGKLISGALVAISAEPISDGGAYSALI